MWVYLAILSRPVMFNRLIFLIPFEICDPRWESFLDSSYFLQEHGFRIVYGLVLGTVLAHTIRMKDTQQCSSESTLSARLGLRRGRGHPESPTSWTHKTLGRLYSKAKIISNKTQQMFSSMRAVCLAPGLACAHSCSHHVPVLSLQKQDFSSHPSPRKVISYGQSRTWERRNLDLNTRAHDESPTQSVQKHRIDTLCKSGLRGHSTQTIPNAALNIFVDFYLLLIWPKEVFTPTSMNYICYQLIQ
ncbi:uncharacterized protein LOC125752708 [Canis lupus dingo]|uniref:uncharacterized protein LOC125752708 n=1 Tax=Canis lupus dingo TaxID=286419 RepID=UPI0020C25879|nr:uncharacterized protein LOC125752708 [Canis lupus dingo]